MSPSVFAGRELRTVTEYERDDEGYLVRTVSVTESAWTEQDQAEILALAEYRDSLCACCGLPRDEVQVHERDAPRFIVSKAMCQARRVLIESQAPFMEQKALDKHPEYRALVWSVGIKEG